MISFYKYVYVLYATKVIASLIQLSYTYDIYTLESFSRSSSYAADVVFDYISNQSIFNK